MKHIKVSLIGAGSGIFSLGLIKDICRTPSLAGSTVSFMDVDAERLNAVVNLCRRYAQEVGTHLKLETTMEQRESLKGADFVINTALPGAHHRLLEGFQIARRHGYRFAGSHHIIHDEAFWINYEQLRFFDRLTEDILELCPEAWHLMVANPVFAGTTHLHRKYPGIKQVGICHGYTGIYSVCDILGLEKEHITFQIPGVNHFVWLTDFYYKGENAFPILDKWIEEKSQSYWTGLEYPGGSALSPKAMDLYKTLGAVPIGDTSHWTGGLWPYWYHSDPDEEKRWGETDAQPFWDDYVNLGRQNAQKIREAAQNPSVKVAEVFPGTSTETFIQMVESMACDIPRVMQGNNILNSGGFIPGIPENVAVEIPTLVSRCGIQGIKTNGLPRPILVHLLKDRVARMEMELEAYNTGRRDLLLQLILMDKHTVSRRQAEQFLDEILALPYHADMRKYYR